MSENDKIAGGPRADVAVGVALMIASAFTYFWLIPYYVTASYDDFGVGARFMPQLVSTLIFALAGAQTVVSWRKLKAEGETGFSASRMVVETLIVAIVSLMAFFLATVVGFFVGAVFLVGLGAYFAGLRSWWKISVLAAGTSLMVDQGAWWIFAVDLP